VPVELSLVLEQEVPGLVLMELLLMQQVATVVYLCFPDVLQ
jgi:hypothetical protein